jgi:hypothetical protein
MKPTWILLSIVALQLGIGLEAAGPGQAKPTPKGEAGVENVTVQPPEMLAKALPGFIVPGVKATLHDKLPFVVVEVNGEWVLLEWQGMAADPRGWYHLPSLVGKGSINPR